MTPALCTLALACFVAVLMLANSRRARCRMAGHDWSRPFTEAGRRVHRCERCSRVEDYRLVAPTAEYVDQLSIDGTAPVSLEVVGRTLDEVTAATARDEERAAIAARVRAKHGSVAAEGRLSS